MGEMARTLDAKFPTASGFSNQYTWVGLNLKQFRRKTNPLGEYYLATFTGVGFSTRRRSAVAISARRPFLPALIMIEGISKIVFSI